MTIIQAEDEELIKVCTLEMTESQLHEHLLRLKELLHRGALSSRGLITLHGVQSEIQRFEETRRKDVTPEHLPSAPAQGAEAERAQ